MKKIILLLLLLLPLTMAAQSTVNTDSVVFVVVETMPEFPGGQQALLDFLSQSVKYPVDAKEQKAEGRTICQFIVNKDGSITDVTVVRSAGHPSLDKEAMRVLLTMPNWKPGRQRGNPVRVRYTVPITFSLKPGKPQSEQSSKPVQPIKPQAPVSQTQAPVSNVRRMGSFADGDTFYVLPAADAGAVLAPNGAMISPNQGYVKQVGNRSNARMKASVSMVEDTMFVSFIHLNDQSLVKKERYLFDSATNAIQLDGEQLYYENGKVICSEQISNKRLRRVTWFGPDGKKERIFIHSGKNDFTEIQLYPSGKTKVRTEHFGLPEAVQTVYDEQGNLVELIPPVLLPAGEQVFEERICRELIQQGQYLDKEYSLAITLRPSDPEAEVVLCDADNTMWGVVHCPLAHTPALIGADTVAYTVYMPFQYRPFYTLLSTPQDSLVIPVHHQTKICMYKWLKWIQSYSYRIADKPEGEEAVFRRNGDTLHIQCYSTQDKSLMVYQNVTLKPNNELAPYGWTKYVKNGQLDYAELIQSDTVSMTRRYYPDGKILSEVIPLHRKSYRFKEKREFYPTGELRSLETIDKKDVSHITYYTKNGAKTKDVKSPVFPGGGKAMGKYLQENLDVRQTVLGHVSGAFVRGWMDVYLEVDEEGHIVGACKGASEITRSRTINASDFDQFIDQMLDCIRLNPTVATPGTIAGEPQRLWLCIRIKDFHFES